MSLSSTELMLGVQSLKRTPPPKTPGQLHANNTGSPLPAGINLSSIKLKRTGMRNSLIEPDFPGHKEECTENVPNELSSKLAKMKARVEGTPEEVEEARPKPLKPKLKPKPNVQKPSEDIENDKSQPPVEDMNKNRLSSSDNIKPLPLLQKLGPAPSKLPKPANLKELLAKYSDIDIVIYPRANPVQAESSENGDSAHNEGGVVNDEDEDEELYDDLMDIAESQKEAPEISGTSVDKSTDPDEGIMEDNYDDIDVVAEQVKKMNEGLEIMEENGSSSDAEQVAGEELYEFICQKNSTPPPTPSRISSSSSSVPESPKRKNDKKGRKELEQQKKKEREEMKRKKDDETRREKEKKIREKDDKQLRKKHKLNPAGNEDISGTGVVKQDSKNEGKLELPVRVGETIYLLNSTENSPPGRWLVKNDKGHLGYVPTEFVSVAVEEDLYDSLDVVTETVKNLAPPSFPPALPSPRTSRDGSRKGAMAEDVFEDGEDEELYEAVGT